MIVAQCISYREQVLILVGCAIILSQMVLYWIERRYWRKIVFRFNPPPLPGDIHFTDRT